MTPAAIIETTRADGVILSATHAGGIRAVGHEQAVARWLPTIRQHKAGVIAMLRAVSVAAGLARQEAADMDEIEVVNWLEVILEDDLATYLEVLQTMRTNPTHRGGLLRMARGEKGGSA